MPESRFVLVRGNLPRAIRRRVDALRREAAGRFGAAQVVTLPLPETPADVLRAELTAAPFLAEGRLVVLMGPGADTE